MSLPIRDQHRPLPRIQWGSYQTYSPSPHTQLRNVLLELLTSDRSALDAIRSQPTPLSTTPMFTTPNPQERYYVDFNIDGCTAPASIQTLSAWGTNLDFAIYTQRISTSEGVQYMIISEARVLDTDREIVDVGDLDEGYETVGPLAVKFAIAWTVKLRTDGKEMAADISRYLNWACLARILQLDVGARYVLKDGELEHDLKYDSYLLDVPDPLVGLGIWGWPIRVAGDGTPFQRGPTGSIPGYIHHHDGISYGLPIEPPQERTI